MLESAPLLDSGSALLQPTASGPGIHEGRTKPGSRSHETSHLTRRKSRPATGLMKAFISAAPRTSPANTTSPFDNAVTSPDQYPEEEQGLGWSAAGAQLVQ